MENILYYILVGILVVAILIAVIILLISVINKIYEKKSKIKYYKMEYERSSDEQDKKFWEKKIRTEIIKCIPGVSWFKD